jgi:hypothetical protein
MVVLTTLVIVLVVVGYVVNIVAGGSIRHDAARSAVAMTARQQPNLFIIFMVYPK